MCNLGSPSTEAVRSIPIPWNIRHHEHYTVDGMLHLLNLGTGEKLVQEVVGILLDNEIIGQPMRDDHNKVYKSFSDVVEGSSLSLHQCGLPSEIKEVLYGHPMLLNNRAFPDILLQTSELLRVKFGKKNPLYGKYLRKVL
ncbi:DNA-directed RNA polymerase subunit beta', partial [Cucurbita argyrosperma subsp. argyrosperma]